MTKNEKTKLVWESFDKRFEKVSKELKAEFDVQNDMALPKISKIVINMGTGRYVKDKAARDKLSNELMAITGQKPKLQNARISVAGFGIREGQPVGLTVTLRGEKMKAFFDKLIAVVLPRLRDFRGVKRSFDKMGNYTLGLSEHTLFPEVNIIEADRPHGLEITMVTTTKDKNLSEAFLEKMGMPFEKEED